MAARLGSLHRFLLGLFLTFTTLASHTLALAADGTPFHLSYSAPPGCPSRAQVLAQLHARAAHLIEARAAEMAPRFRIDVSRDETGVLTSVEMTLLDGAYSRRVLRTNDCDEAIAAATVIVALVLAPQADSTTPERPLAQQAEPKTPSDDPKAQQERLPGPPARSEDLDETETPFQISAGGQFGVPATMFRGTFGGGGFVEAQLYPDQWLSPSVRVALVAQGVDEADDRGTAEIRLMTGRLSVCPVRLPEKTRAFLRPCALGEVGRLLGRGQDIVNGREIVIPWRAVGASLRAVWSFPVVALEVEGAAVFPLTTDAFYFDPTPVAPTFEVPSVYASVLVGLSVHWP